MPAPGSVTFNKETTEQPKIQHKKERCSVWNENQNSKEDAVGVKISCLAMTQSEEMSRLNVRDWTREIVITSAEGHCDCGGGWIILFESDREEGGESWQCPFL
jgi:hypothetical protein